MSDERLTIDKLQIIIDSNNLSFIVQVGNARGIYQLVLVGNMNKIACKGSLRELHIFLRGVMYNKTSN